MEPRAEVGTVPVYVPKFNKFFETASEASFWLWDDGHEPTVIAAHPCTVGKASTPDLHQHVQEVWGEDFEDPDAVDLDFSKETAELLAEVQRRLEAEAPTVWTPRTKETVALPPVECPSCGYKSNETPPEHAPTCHFCKLQRLFDGSET